MELEKRTINIEFRASDDEDSRTIEGYAALYNERSEQMWGFVEVIEPGAFDEADMSDVRALFNHDPNYILARSSSGTLELEKDEQGLKYRFDVPDTTFGNDFLKMVRRGDISQSSFAFTIARDGDKWEEDEEYGELRKITKVERLYDVSPVTYPAYSQTTVSARSLAQFRENKARENRVDENDQAPNPYSAKKRALKLASIGIVE